jgi:ribosomal protein S27AE
MKRVNKSCAQCGAPLIGVAPHQQFCPACAKQRAEDSRRRSRANRVELQYRRCLQCGNFFIARSSRQKYCCQRCELIANCKLSDPEIASGPEQRSAPPKLSADEVTLAARAEGLSYGQYSVKHGLYADVVRRSERSAHEQSV